jgi:nucleoside 2-deoxyribosyltransferase
MKIYFAGPLFTPYERGYIDECTARLRADGFEVFVPHEHELAQSDTTPAWIFAKDMEGLGPADAVLALLDGPMVDDGTACEIGVFYALMQSDGATNPAKKGVVGLLTDLRGSRGESTALNLFVAGCIEATGGEVVRSFDEALSALRRLRG